MFFIMFKTLELAVLRNLLCEMEREIGLRRLSDVQRDVYYAACLLTEHAPSAHVEALRSHPVACDVSRPTFYRAMRELIGQGYLAADGEGRTGMYRVIK